jgi:hypothetical protein
MGGSQAMLIAIGLALIMRVWVTVNNNVGDTKVAILENEAIACATSIGQSMMERIGVKGFDHNFAGGVDTAAAAFAGTLGFDSGEVAGNDTTFNDVDDYNGYSEIVSTPRFGNFVITCSVAYANENHPYSTTMTRTFLKRIDVSITNTFMVDTNDSHKIKLTSPIVLSKYISYR